MQQHRLPREVVRSPSPGVFSVGMWHWGMRWGWVGCFTSISSLYIDFFSAIPLWEMLLWLSFTHWSTYRPWILKQFIQTLMQRQINQGLTLNWKMLRLSASQERRTIWTVWNGLGIFPPAEETHRLRLYEAKNWATLKEITALSYHTHFFNGRKRCRLHKQPHFPWCSTKHRGFALELRWDDLTEFPEPQLSAQRWMNDVTERK